MSDIKFYIATFQKNDMIRKTSFLKHESPSYPLEIFKLLNKREERWNNVGETAVIFPQIFQKMLGAPVNLLGIKKLAITGIESTTVLNCWNVV